MPKQFYNQHFGLNTESSPEDLKDSETPDARNDDTSHPGIIQTRPGMSKVSSSAQADTIVSLFSLETDDEIQKRIAILDDGTVLTF